MLHSSYPQLAATREHVAAGGKITNWATAPTSPGSRSSLRSCLWAKGVDFLNFLDGQPNVSRS